jgi:hypothetical protein
MIVRKEIRTEKKVRASVMVRVLFFMPFFWLFQEHFFLKIPQSVAHIFPANK